MDFQSLLKTKFMTAVLALVFVSVAFITVELYWQKREVDSEMSRLQEQADKLGQGNQELSELIKYLDTPEYKEREAREKLNLKREGEEVVVLPESSDDGQVAGASSGQQANPTKWLNYFFGNP